MVKPKEMIVEIIFFTIGFIKHYFWYLTFKDDKAILKSQIWEICGKSLKKVH